MKYLLSIIIITLLASCSDKSSENTSPDDKTTIFALKAGDYWIYKSGVILSDTTQTNNEFSIDSLVVTETGDIFTIAHYRDGQFIGEYNCDYNTVNLEVLAPQHLNDYNNPADWGLSLQQETWCRIYSNYINDWNISSHSEELSVEFRGVSYDAQFTTVINAEMEDIDSIVSDTRIRKSTIIPDNMYTFEAEHSYTEEDSIIYEILDTRKVWRRPMEFIFEEQVGILSMKFPPYIVEEFTVPPKSKYDSTYYYDGYEYELLRTSLK